MLLIFGLLVGVAGPPAALLEVLSTFLPEETAIAITGTLFYIPFRILGLI